MQHYPEPYIEFLVYFHTDRDFFECHEVLEAYWKSVPDSPLRDAWLGLIQIAVGLYHQRRGNLAGACQMLKSALTHLTVSYLKELGIDPPEFQEMISNRLRELSEEPMPDYVDFNMPLSDPGLLQLCMARAASKNKLWLDQSNMSNPFLIHKHTLRDRTEVVEERRKQLALKQIGLGDEAQ